MNREKVKNTEMFFRIELNPYSSHLAMTYLSMLGRLRQSVDVTREKIWVLVGDMVVITTYSSSTN